MTGGLKETLERTGLDLKNLKPGPENLLTGFPLEAARELGAQIAQERRLEFREFKEPANAQNTLDWVVAWKEKSTLPGSDRGRMRGWIFVTDQASQVRTFELKTSIRGTRELGEYVLAIPTEENIAPVQLNVYFHNPKSH